MTAVASRWHSPRAGQDDRVERIDDLIARKAERYADRGPPPACDPSRAPTQSVRSLAARFPIAICSGALRPEIEFALTRLGLDEFIDAIIAAEDTERCKPDPEGYFLALDALRSTGCTGLEAAHCLVVEDSLAGVRSAKAAGMWAVGVTHSYTSDELRKAGADAVIADLSDLNPSWVERLFHPEISP